MFGGGVGVVENTGPTSKELGTLAKGLEISDRLQDAMFQELAPSGFRPSQLMHWALGLLGMRAPRCVTHHFLHFFLIHPLCQRESSDYSVVFVGSLMGIHRLLWANSVIAIGY